MNDLIGRQVDIGCEQATTATPPVQGKRIKGYAVTTTARLQSLPDLPTANEAGLKGFALGVWHGLYAPAGTPAPIVQKLSGALQGALKDPDLIKRFDLINTEPIAAESRHARGASEAPAQRGRSLGADHQGGGRVRRLIASGQKNGE